MSDLRTREQHHRKFQELINPENWSKCFRSDTPSSRGGNNIPSSSRGKGNNIPSSKSGGNDIPSNRGEGNNNTPISNNNTLSSGGEGNNNLLAAE